METSFSELKQKETVNIADGRRLGKVSDVVFTVPEGRVQGIVVPGGKGLRWGKSELFIGLKNVVKIGEDVVLVELKPQCEPVKEKWGERAQPPCPPKHPRDRRDYGEYE